MKKILLILAVVVLNIFIKLPAYAENFYIEYYNVSLDVKKNKTVDVKEEILVNFTKPSHGIYRTIPVNRAIVSNISVNENFKTKYNAGIYNIKIGNEGRIVNGEKLYKINYRYRINDNKNEFYYNIIGTDWPVNINKVSFKVAMPEDFDFSKISLSSGIRGTKENTHRVVIKKEDKSIIGYTTKPLSKKEGITIKIDVPKGYFADNKLDSIQIYVLAGIILLTLISCLIWLIIGKGRHNITPVITSNPPENINSIYSQMILESKVTSKGLTALLLELAYRGYINIEEMGYDFEITKGREYDGKNIVEKILLQSLEAEEYPLRISFLQASCGFYEDCEKIKNILEDDRKMFFEKISINSKIKILMNSLSMSVFILTLYVLVCHNVTVFDGSLFFLIFPFAGLWFYNVFESKFWILNILTLTFILFPMSLLLFISGYTHSSLPVVCVGIVCFVISSLCSKYITKRNQLGETILAQLLGLKKFIKLAQKESLEALVKENPQYFYYILPYAYIFNLSDTWIKQFETIYMQKLPPYKGIKINKHNFSKFNENMRKATIPNHSNGGMAYGVSGGGGCSSGGGCGGGSW